MAGRPPKPTKLKVVQGTFRKGRAVNEPDPELLNSAPKAPLSLKAHTIATQFWTATAKNLVNLGLLSNIDLYALECCALAYERMTLAERKLVSKKSMTMATPSGYEQARPEISIASQARKEVKDFLIQFGMTPASRSRIDIKKKDGEKKDPMEELLGNG